MAVICPCGMFTFNYIPQRWGLDVCGVWGKIQVGWLYLAPACGCTDDPQ